MEVMLIQMLLFRQDILTFRTRKNWQNIAIFYRNSINIGLPIIECPEAAKGIADGDEVEVDFDSGKIYNKTKGEEYQGQAFPEFMQKIISSGGLINYINNR